MKKMLVLSAVLALSLAPSVLHADTFKDSILRAELVFLNDPTLFGTVIGDPTNLLTGGTGYAGTRTVVGSGQEYSYNDGVATYSANANQDGITLRVKCDAGVTLATCNTEPGFLWLFKDDAFTNSNFSLDPTSNLFITPPTFVSDNEITFISPLSFDPCGCENLTLRNSRAIIEITPTPEPASIALLGTGVLGIIGTARRRFKK